MIGAADIVTCARAYLGVPWVHQGRSRAGLDCGGLIVRVAQDLGLSAFDVGAYGRQPDGKSLRRYLWAFGARPLAELAPGAILLMRFVRFPQHLAIATERGMIHTYAQAGGVVEHTLGRWRARVVEAYAFPGAG